MENGSGKSEKNKGSGKSFQKLAAFDVEKVSKKA